MFPGKGKKKTWNWEANKKRDLVTIKTLHVTFLQTFREPLPFKLRNERPHYSIREHSSKKQRQVHSVGTNHPCSHESRAEIEVETAKNNNVKFSINKNMFQLSTNIMGWFVRIPHVLKRTCSSKPAIRMSGTARTRILLLLHCKTTWKIPTRDWRRSTSRNLVLASWRMLTFWLMNHKFILIWFWYMIWK